MRRLLAIQAQDLRSARRAIRARSRRTTAAAVDRMLTRDRALVLTWLNRGTLHLVTAEDYPWLQGLTAPTVRNANTRRLRQEGVGEADAERGVAAITSALGAEGPLTRDALATRLAAAGVPCAGQAIVHLLFLAALRGLTVRGPVRSAAGQAYALTRDWLGIDPPADLLGDERDRALAELARRYLAGHAPARDRDLAAWSGLPLRDARRGLSLIGGELAAPVDGLVDLVARDRPTRARLAPRLLASFDPLVIGWKDRDLVVAPEHQAAFYSKNGILPPVVLVRGRSMGTWRLGRDGSLELIPYAERWDAATEAALHRDAEDLRRFEAAGAAAAPVDGGRARHPGVGDS